MQVILDGAEIKTENDLHSALAKSLDFGEHYGNNLAALWDRLTSDLERPVEVVWRDSGLSRKALGDDLFGRIVKLMNDVEDQDASFGWEDRFVLTLG